jgi:hypothetical protein
MRLITVIALSGSFASGAFAQSVVSAKAGLVHYTEGDVLVAGKPVEKKISLFTTMRNGDILTTGEGRAEVLLGPGVIVRIAEHSMLKLVNNEPTDTRVELLEGSAILEGSESIKENRTSVLVKGIKAEIRKDGVYSFATKPEAEIRVWSGEAALIDDGKTTTLKGGKVATVGTEIAVAKFDKDETDALYRWAKRRSGYLSLANISGARKYEAWGTPASGLSGWHWNPYFNMFTFIPATGIWSSPFGWRYYSPRAVLSLYYPPSYMGGWGGGGISADGRSIPSFNPGYGYATIPSRSPVGVAAGGGYSGGGGGMPAGGGGSAAAGRAAAGGGAVGATRGGGGRGGN